MIEFQNVSFSYPDSTDGGLKNIDLTIPDGQCVLLCGRSGCGKSTLLKLLAGKEQPDAGEISIPQGWHSAMLSPEPYVITWTSGQRNVAMACGVGKTPEERYEHAAEFVRMVGLEDYADLTPVELSTGMKQRLGLARVLAGQAELLLMDEPFAALDFLTRAELQAQLLTIQQRLPRTIVLVTHQLEEALLLGQKIVVMHPDSTICEFDLTDLPSVQVGDEVEIFGRNQRVDVLADAAGTIPYELTCAVSRRVPRIYYKNGQETEKELLLRF